MLTAVLSGCATLLATEGGRRRVRLELQHAVGIDGDGVRARSVVTDLHARFSAAQVDGGDGAA